MADWSLPTTTTSYLTAPNVLDDISARLNDSATLFNSAPSNQPNHAMRFNRSTATMQEWDGATWGDRAFAIAGGGTGASTAAAARSNLGIGTLGVQASAAVSITGGAISGATYDATNLHIPSQAAGDLLYAVNSSSFTRLPIDIDGKILITSSGFPIWSPAVGVSGSYLINTIGGLQTFSFAIGILVSVV